MPGKAVEDLLAAEVILRDVTRRVVPNTALSSLFGWAMQDRNPDDVDDAGNQTGNMIEEPLRNFKYDFIDETKLVAEGREPGAPLSLIAPLELNVVTGVMPRVAESIPLLHEKLNQLRQYGGPRNIVDQRGQRYIQIQKNFMTKRVANLIEFQTAAMIRGQYYYQRRGDQILHSMTSSGNDTEINFRIPDDNKTQLDMGTGGDLISASWATASTDIPANIFAVNDAMVSLTGRGVEHILVSNVVWNHVMNNTAVQDQAGSANTPFERIDRRGSGDFSAVLRSMPWLEWHIIDYRLNEYTGSADADFKLIPDDIAVFLPNPSSEWVQYLNGMETVTEGPNGNVSEQFGFYPYAYPTNDPSGWKLNSIHNGLPALYNPNAIAYGTVVF